MAKLLKLRRGTTSQHGSFTGAEGEVTVDTDKETLVVHDGSTAGGHPVAAEDMANVSSASIVGRLGAGSIAHVKLAGDCIDGDNIQDDVVNSEHIAAGAIDLEHMASESVDEDNLKISNAGTNGQFLSKQSGDAGGLTWATPSTTATEATNVTVSANNSTDETVYPTFVDGATGAQGIETDTGLTYNPSTGLLTAVGLTLSGNLTVNGTTTTINSTTLAVDDKNIVLGDVDTPSDTTADGGGITLKGASDKTITWTNSTDTWDFNQGIKIDGGLTVDTNTLHVDASNNRVGVGTATPASILHIESSSPSIRFVDTDASGGFGMVGVNNTSGSLVLRSDDQDALANSYMGFEVDGGTKLYINSSGNVGIGTTSPSSKLEVNGSVTDDKGNLRSIPRDNKTSAYTLVATDAGKCISITTGGITINQSIFSDGDAVTIINNSGSDQTITQGTSFTLYNSADATTGNRILAGRGICTLYFVGHATAYISGAGLS